MKLKMQNNINTTPIAVLFSVREREGKGEQRNSMHVHVHREHMHALTHAQLVCYNSDAV